MDHVEPSHLVELALGHTSSDKDVSALEHVASCPRCHEELGLMTRVVTAARGAQTPDTAAPPKRVWQRITQELSCEAHRLPYPEGHAVRRPAPGSGDRRNNRTAGTRTREAFLVLAPIAGVLLVRWLRVRAGRGPDRRRARRPWPPWWRRAC